MLRSTEQLLDAGYAARVFDEHDLARVYGGSRARRYGLANKAMGKHELVRLRRGIYCLGQKYRAPISKYYVANRVNPASILSMMSGLSFHGWIPERVEGVSSACPQSRPATYETPFGQLRYRPVATRRYTWMRAVTRHERQGGPFFVAEPLRALADQIYVSGASWSTMAYLLDGLRIYPDGLEALTPLDFEVIAPIYRSHRVRGFLAHLRAELGV